MASSNVNALGWIIECPFEINFRRVSIDDTLDLSIFLFRYAIHPRLSIRIDENFQVSSLREGRNNEIPFLLTKEHTLEHLLNWKFDICRIFVMKMVKGRTREEKIKVTHQILSVTNCQINWIKKERTTIKKGTRWRHGRDKNGKITYTSHSAQTANFHHHLKFQFG